MSARWQVADWEDMAETLGVELPAGDWGAQPCSLEFLLVIKAAAEKQGRFVDAINRQFNMEF